MNKYLEKIAEAKPRLGPGVFKPYTNAGNTGGGSIYVNRAAYHNSTPPVSNPDVKTKLNIRLNAGMSVKNNNNFNTPIKAARRIKNPVAQAKIDSVTSAKK